MAVAGRSADEGAGADEGEGWRYDRGDARWLILRRLSTRAFWVFDRPLHRDWLFLAGLAAGVAFAVYAAARPGRHSALVLAYELFWALPGGVMAVGVVGGTIRELFRALRRGARP